MSKNETVGLIIVSFVVIIIAAALIFKDKLKSAVEKITAGESDSATGTASGSASSGCGFPSSVNTSGSVDINKVVKRCSYGPEVYQLQIRLNRAISNYNANHTDQLTALVNDGKFGALAEAALYKLTEKKEISLHQFDLFTWLIL